MAIVSVSLDFSTDDGLPAEMYRVGFTSGFPATGTWDNTDGNPAGSAAWTLSNPTVGLVRYILEKTFEDLGVPVGSTINGVSNFAIDANLTIVGTVADDIYPQMAMRIGAGTSATNHFIGRFIGPYTSTQAWTALGNEYSNFNPFPATSSDVVNMQFYIDSGDPDAASSTTLRYDNLSFDIDYTVASGVFLTGNLQAQDSQVSGQLWAGIIHTATGNLQAQDSIMAGYLRAMPATTEAAKSHTVDTYTLDVDGVSIPLISFTVKREVSLETAQIVVPGLFENEIAAATALTINVQSFDVYGVETNTQLFTGSLSYFSTLNSDVTGNCSGAASWPAPAVRYFKNVSYYSDNGNGQIFRTGINPDFNPGDIGMYGVRRINITRVTFSANAQQSVMELSSFG